MILSRAQYEQFTSACTQQGDNMVSVYEWGFGACDDWNTLQKAANTPSFTATVRPPTRSFRSSAHIRRSKPTD